MSQTDFAKLLKIKREQWARYERDRIPDPDVLVRISVSRGVTIDWILTGNDVAGGLLPDEDMSDPLAKARHQVSRLFFSVGPKHPQWVQLADYLDRYAPLDDAEKVTRSGSDGPHGKK